MGAYGALGGLTAALEPLRGLCGRTGIKPVLGPPPAAGRPEARQKKALPEGGGLG